MRKLLQVTAIASYILLLSGCASDSIEDLLPACDTKTIVVQATAIALPGCTDTGQIQLSASGSTDFSYSLDGINYQSSPDFTGLGAGNYTVFARDGEGCTGSADFVLESNDGLTLNLTASVADCGEDNGNIMADVTGGTGVYEFSINGGAFQSGSDFANLAADEYEITARDSDGCTTTQMINVATDVTLSGNIMTIITTNCAISGCHGDSRSPLMNTADEIIASAERIRVRALGLDPGRQPMPPSGFISQELQDQIDCWVNDGALNN